VEQGVRARRGGRRRCRQVRVRGDRGAGRRRNGFGQVTDDSPATTFSPHRASMKLVWPGPSRRPSPRSLSGVHLQVMAAVGRSRRPRTSPEAPRRVNRLPLLRAGTDRGQLTARTVSGRRAGAASRPAAGRARSRPRNHGVMRSPLSSISSIRWVMKITPTPSAARRRSAPNSDSAGPASAEVA